VPWVVERRVFDPEDEAPPSSLEVCECACVCACECACVCAWEREREIPISPCTRSLSLSLSLSLTHTHTTRAGGRGAEGRGGLDLYRLLFFITLETRVERYTKSTSLKYAPSSEPLHISAE